MNTAHAVAKPVGSEKLVPMACILFDEGHEIVCTQSAVDEDIVRQARQLLFESVGVLLAKCQPPKYPVLPPIEAQSLYAEALHALWDSLRRVLKERGNGRENVHICQDSPGGIVYVTLG